MNFNRVFCAFALSLLSANLHAASGQMTTLGIAAGQGHSMALRSDGTVWVWGTNRWDQLATTNVTDSTFPLRVSGISNVTAISAGEDHALALKSNGTVWGWGYGGDGELGNGNLDISYIPVQAIGITNAVAVSGGGFHSLAVLANGQVMAWGYNADGELGDGTTNSTVQPGLTLSLTDATRVAAGEIGSMALTATGEVWCWGDGISGEIGNGTFNSSTSPVKVLSNVVAIASGAYHNLALKSDGTVWAWGNNFGGELGLGNTSDTNVPTQVTALTGVKTIAAGSYTSTATLSNGQTMVWGYPYGTTPTLIDTPPVFTQLAGGYNPDFSANYFLGLAGDGSVSAWGLNYIGEFGNGNDSNPGVGDYLYAPTISFTATATGRYGKSLRGNLNPQINYCSAVVPMDLEQGVNLNRTGTDAYCFSNTVPWFLSIQKQTLFQSDSISSGTNLNRFVVENPQIAFGSQSGGSPLYLNQTYSFSVYAGGYDESTNSATNVIHISVYDRSQFNGSSTNVAPTNSFNIVLPRRTIAADSNAWVSFMTNGASITVETNGLRTTVEFLDNGNTNNSIFNRKLLGISWMTNASGTPAVMTNYILTGYKISHTATSTNYSYKVDVLGKVQVGTNTVAPMATNSSGAWTPLPLYTLDFDQQPPLRSIYLDRLYFAGIPMPPTYSGRSLAELNGLTMPVTNALVLTNSAYTNLDASPELRRHPTLDQFVLDMNKDPLALTSYVINEIELTDPYSGSETNVVIHSEANCGGVDRGALGTFLEGQGSPIEQCSLLIYLLRQAGYPAVYVFPTNSNIRLLDTRISQLWQMQVKGVVSEWGAPYLTNSLIRVSYPWVAATIGTNTVHIFPWLKDTELVEGVDLYHYMPTNYNTGLKWIEDYVRGKTNILNLDPRNVPSVLFPKFVQQNLNTNLLGEPLSLDNLGVRAFNRRHQFPDWSHLPQPNLVTNLTTVAVVGSLSDSTNSFPFLQHIFNTARVEVYTNSVAVNNLVFTTGDWYACDWHDRKFLLFTNNSRLHLWMAPFVSTNTSTVQGFTNAAPSSTALLSNSIAYGTSTNITVRTIHTRRDSNFFYGTWFPNWDLAVTNDTHCIRGDVVGICLDFGRVTLAMLQPYAETYWSLQRQRATNSAFTPAIQDYTGTAAYLLGLNYFQKCDAFDAQNQRWHKIRGLYNFENGLGIIGTTAKSTNIQAKLDMAIYVDEKIGNGSLRPDSDVPEYSIAEDYLQMEVINASAEEHDTIQRMFPSQNAVSTVRLLQLAQARATNSNSPILELVNNNCVAQGNLSHSGYSTTLLKNWDTNIWNSVTNSFKQQGGDYTRVLITPGKITNAPKSYIGMGALILGVHDEGALISANSAPLNGGWGDVIPGYDPDPSSYSFPYNLYSSGNDGYYYGYNNPGGQNFQPVYSPIDNANLSTGGNNFAYSTIQITYAGDVSSGLNISGTSTGSTIQTAANVGWFDQAVGWIQSVGQTVDDPVDVVSGSFYVDAADLTLAGPLPLQLRRNYLSQNLANNEFGYGWKQNFTPYLVLSTNPTGDSIIYAAELDGCVIAYHQTNGVWRVLPQDNPTLNNDATHGIGATANLFNSVLTTNGSIYTISAPDGSTRTYQMMTNFAVTSGTNSLNRIRPYLTKWQDHAGNYHTFSYGTNASSDDYGQLNRIDSANGNYFVFKYDFYGRIIQAFTGDGRFVQYEYDDYGDLITVTLPDNSQCQYEYEHYTFNTTNGTTITTNIDSDHLMLQEIKPNGRIIANTYDTLRRVTTQASTVGTNLVLVTNAFFYYTNNATSLTNHLIGGTTRVEDVFHNPTLYYYTNSLITNTVDPFGSATVQTWFPDTNNSALGYYPRSLQYSVDKRGLTNQFYYDSFGNVTQMVLRGDLTGNAAYNDAATNVYTYTTNQLPSLVTDPVGNAKQLTYDSSDPFRLAQQVSLSGGIPFATNLYFYTNVATASSLGTSTNYAYGLCWRAVRGGGATNDSVFDGRGFKLQSTAYPATADSPAISDPPVVTYLSYNSRGQLYQQQIAGGALTQIDYDPMGRTTARQVYDQNGQSLANEFNYYNRNGELEWYDGARSNPEDYVYYIYDGAGRVTQTIRWRSQVNADGSGVEAPAGYDLYSTTFQQYDGFGNLRKTTDARGVVTTNKWDALGRLVQQTVLETDGSTLKSEGYAYEPGGSPIYFTNALGGVTQTIYTSAGKPRYRSTPDLATNAWTYRLDGRVRREYQSNGSFWESTYDDANRRTTRVLYNFASVPLATNVTDLDARGNTIRRVDAGGNAFTNSYDGLDRIKTATGPMITFDPPPGAPPDPGGTPTPVQQSITNYYDAAGLARTNINALGEKTITLSDALGRVTSVEIRDASNTQIRLTTTSYSADHQSQTVTQGSGANALVSTTYTDNQNQPVLTIGYPSAGTTEFVLRRYDLVGNLTSEAHDTSTGGTPTQWTTASYAYDGLNRIKTKIERDNATTTYGYDQGSNPTSRAMPAGLSWHSAYNNANQMLYDFNLGTDGTSITRSNHYTYYLTTGLLLTKTDGRGVTCTHFYDDFLRLSNSVYTGSLPEHNLTTTWSYDPRGLMTNVSEAYASTNTDPSTSVSRTYDAYGQLQGEGITVGTATYPSFISRNSAGRRTSLGLTQFGYNFTWRADGMLTSSTGTTGGGTYSYDNAGQLVSRTLGPRVTTTSSRDGEGRPLSVATTLSGSAFMTETLAYTGDGLMASHKIVRNDFTDNRSFTYAPSTRWLTSEIVGLNSSANWTNNFVYDKGAAQGPGILTSAAQPSSAMWSGGADVQSRVTSQTNHTIARQAYGRVNGQASVTATLDNVNIPVQITGTNAQTWEATLELTPGTHTLTATAKHPSGQFTTNASVTITNNATDSARTSYSGAGQITNMVWLTSGGATNRTRSLSWDARNRLLAVTERDTNNNGFDWTAAYDGLGRRIQTTETIVTNGTALSSTPIVVTHYFDPSYEFLELGVVEGLKTTWKLMGPDMDGTYGGQNGTGGFDAMIPGPELFCPTMGDINGNIHFVYDVGHANLATNTSRITGYGAVPGYRPLELGGSGNLVAKHAWRNRARECWGGVWMGANWYDMDSAQFLTFDERGFALGRSIGFNTFRGNPWPYWDADGRLATKFANNFAQSQMNLAQNEGAPGIMGDQIAQNSQTVYNNAIATGSGSAEAYYESGAYVAGSFTGFTPLYQGASGFDVPTGNPLSTTDRWIQGTTGAIGVVGTGFTLGGFVPGVGGATITADTANTQTITVLGSGKDVAPYVGQPGFNTFTGVGIPQAELDTQNALWLNESIRRGDQIWLLTDPEKHAAFLSTLPSQPQSAYLNLELPMLGEYSGVNAVPKYVTAPK